MKAEGQQTLGEGDKKAVSKRATEKEEITSTELPEVGNTISTKETPGIRTRKKTSEDTLEKIQVTGP